MSKYKRKKRKSPVDPTRTQVVRWLADKYECGTSFIYGVLNGSFKTGDYLQIIKDYNTKYAEIKNVLAK